MKLVLVSLSDFCVVARRNPRRTTALRRPSALAPTLPGETAAGDGYGPHGDHDHQSRSAAVLRPGSGADAFLLGPRGGAVVPAGGGARSFGADAAVGNRDGRGRRLASPVPTRSAGAGEPDAGPARHLARANGGNKAVELSQVPGKATDLEKAYIAAIAARRDPAAKDPDEAFVQGLRACWPGIRTRWRRSLPSPCRSCAASRSPDKKPNGPGSTEAVAILRGLLTKAPEHPGVHHYIIHGFEGSSFAKDAWPSCEKYAQLVPNIPHALHMPGHIYSQTGRWEDAAKSFGAAAVNERTWMKQDKLYGDGHHGHNVHYLATAYSLRRPLRRRGRGRERAAGVFGKPRPEGSRRPDDRRTRAGLVRHAAGAGAVRKMGRRAGRPDAARIRQASAGGLAPLGARGRLGQ